MEDRLILPKTTEIQWTTEREVNGYQVLLTSSNGMAHAMKGDHDDIFSMQDLRKKKRPEG
jgi:hypothetical protein